MKKYTILEFEDENIEVKIEEGGVEFCFDGDTGIIVSHEAVRQAWLVIKDMS